MGKLTRSAGRVLGAGSLVLAGAGLLVLAGAGSANARPASTSTNACDKVFATIDSFNATFTKHPGEWGPVATAATDLTRDASTGSAAVKSTVSTFVADLRADVAARRVISRPKLVADGDAIVAACSAQATSPSGAPATGGGSTADIQDPALFGVGGAVVLVGIGVLGLARRNGPRGSPGHG
jgi:hypothetical protein